jgi:diadenosine tetraphosphate (Ap4A) HIT family hydrolase
MTTDFRHDRIGSAIAGENPTVIRSLPMSFAVLGDVQWLPGYCVLLVDRPGVSRLTDLPRVQRQQFLASMDVLAEAVQNACREVMSGFRRMNLDILGNTDDFLHAHVWPRYDWEPPERVTKPVWLYPPEFWTLDSLRLGPQHQPLRDAIGRQLDALTGG